MGNSLHKIDLHDRIRAALERIPKGVRTRFAPSPTGYLHLGHVVNAIFVWGIAKARQGRVVVRLEDHDRQRWRLEHEKGILEEIQWLGFEADEGLSVAELEGVSAYRQSDCPERYRDSLAALTTHGLAYGCGCSRKVILAGQYGEGDELRYPGFCRERPDMLSPPDGLTVRVKVDGQAVSFEDLLLGPQKQVPAQQCGDFSLRDRHGQWTYQFACVCDDIAQDIDLVVRGQDLVFSTGRQILLGKMLGRQQPPLFLHHPLLFDESGRKLSKRHCSESVSAMREQGRSPEEVIGEAAWRCGLLDAPGPLGATEVSGLFARVGQTARFGKVG